MKLTGRLDASKVGTAVAVVVVGALLYAIALSGLSHPSHAKQRLAKLDDDLARAEALRSGPGAAEAYPAHALCKGGAELAQAVLKEKLASMAAAANVNLTLGDLTPAGEPQRGQKLMPMTVGFDADGPYEHLLSFTRSLAVLRPVLFIDTAGLEQDAGTVKLKFAGRIYCSTFALQ